MMFGTLPLYLLVLLVALYFLVRSLSKVVSRTKDGKQISLKHFAFFLLSLVGGEGLYALFLWVYGSLGHGTDMGLYVQKFILSFVIVVVLPVTCVIAYRMSASRHAAKAIVSCCLAVLACSTISLTPGTRATLVDEKEEPVSGAQVYYVQIPAQNGPQSGSGCEVTDGQGVFRIGRVVHFHPPFFYYTPFSEPVRPPQIEITIVAPSLHNVSIVKDAYGWNTETATSRFKIRREAERTLVVLGDLSDQPEEWLGSLWNYMNAVSILHTKQADEDKARLLSSWKSECNHFSSRYSDIPVDASGAGETWGYRIKNDKRYDRALEDWLPFYEKLWWGKNHDP
jgi:hypothetical protein